MPVEITMPQLSDTMTEGTVVKWLKKEGEKVKAGEMIAEVETDKATMETESFEGGTLAVQAAKEGEKISVGQLIAVLATGKEAVEDVRKQYAGGKKASAGPVDAASVAPKAGQIHEGSAPQPALRHGGSPPGSEGELGAESAGQHETATIVATLPPPTPSNGNGHHGHGDRVKISPLARRIAEDRGIDIGSLKGSGPSGRIVQADVLAAAGDRPAQVPSAALPASANNAPTAAAKPDAPARTAEAGSAAPPAPSRVGTGQTHVIELSKMRQTIATRLQQSKQQLPHFYETIDIDMEALSSLREKVNANLEKQKIRLSISDFVNKAIAVALTQHPALNAHFDARNSRITRFGDVHLGIAVALPDGLIVPVLRSVDQMGIKEIRQRSVDLVDRARGQRLRREELSGATFTVSTLGMFGIREFAAIINPPEVGILAVGTAEPRAVVREGQIIARTMMTVTLSVDHRAVDGAMAAEFLRTLKNLLEEPGMMLV